MVRFGRDGSWGEGGAMHQFSEPLQLLQAEAGVARLDELAACVFKCDFLTQ